jgi:hypothetical protein
VSFWLERICFRVGIPQYFKVLDPHLGHLTFGGRRNHLPSDLKTSPGRDSFEKRIIPLSQFGYGLEVAKGTAVID